MKSINKHDIVRSWSENETIDLEIAVFIYDEETGESASGVNVIGLAEKKIDVNVFDETGTKVLDFFYNGVNNDSISVVEDEYRSAIVIHFRSVDYSPGHFMASPDASKWFELEIVYKNSTTEPLTLKKHVFPHISKDGAEMRFYIRLLQDRTS